MYKGKYWKLYEEGNYLECASTCKCPENILSLIMVRDDIDDYTKKKAAKTLRRKQKLKEERRYLSSLIDDIKRIRDQIDKLESTGKNTRELNELYELLEILYKHFWDLEIVQQAFRIKVINIELGGDESRVDWWHEANFLEGVLDGRIRI